MVALSMTLSDSNRQFQGHPIVRRRISRKRPAIWRRAGYSAIAELLVGVLKHDVVTVLVLSAPKIITWATVMWLLFKTSLRLFVIQSFRDALRRLPSLMIWWDVMWRPFVRPSVRLSVCLFASAVIVLSTRVQSISLCLLAATLQNVPRNFRLYSLNTVRAKEISR